MRTGRKPKGPSAKNKNPGVLAPSNDNTAEPAAAVIKVPILVTERVTIGSDAERRVPITTPRPTTSTTTAATTTTTPNKTVNPIRKKNGNGRNKNKTEKSAPSKEKAKPQDDKKPVNVMQPNHNNGVQVNPGVSTEDKNQNSGSSYGHGKIRYLLIQSGRCLQNIIVN